MATAETRTTHEYLGDPSYPTSDGRQMGESDIHFTLLAELVLTLRNRLADNPMAYAGGDMLLFYEQGNRRKHVSPDVFVTLGVPREPMRLNYIPWLEGKMPDVVIEITSRTTRRKDQTKKLILYQDVLKIPEYFLFDPSEDYLKPSLQGHRLVDDEYVPIPLVNGRLHCASLNLLLGRVEKMLRLFDAETGELLPTPDERADQEREAADRERETAERERQRAERQREQAEAENRRLRRRIEELTRRLESGGSAEGPA